ncbi:MAG TPA: phosphotransferase [Usitatibacter sp.]|nr:phosphotransferase [Usitatibacter sp.]
MNGEGYTQITASLRSMDHRFSALEAWLRAPLAGAPLRIERASTDASFRRYFRVFTEGRTLIAMDAPPEREDSRAFVKVARLLREAGLNAPEILAFDYEQGFLLVTDLGTRLYLQAVQEDDPKPLFSDATTALVRWQLSSREGVLPAYDDVLLRREISLFPDWYIARHLGVTLTQPQRETLESVFRIVLARNLAEPRVYVHRDFMPRNLMVSETNPGILDFQDAAHGPISYDVACLYRDAFVSWDEDFVLDGTIRYWEKARAAKLPVPPDFGDFWRDVEWMGLQRHLKVLGIFARLNYRDGKPGYLADTPRFIGYVRHAVSRYDELAPLGRLLDEIRA